MNKYIIIYGFSIFAMFFGSGNLVFPLQIGAQNSDNWVLAFIGLFLTGVILPFCGLFVIKLYDGNYYNFFNEAGKVAGTVLPLFTLSLLGSFGVVPRCIAVAYGGVTHIFPNLSLAVFSAVFCIICFVMCINDRIMINILGKILTPILLISLIALIMLGAINSRPIHFGPIENYNSLWNGVMQGYEIMDLFASFFFSAVTFNQLKQTLQPILLKDNTYDTKYLMSFAIKASVIGSLLLALIYMGFVYLGSSYKDIIINLNPELMLPTIAYYVLGSKSSGLVAIAVLFSCLTTAVALNSIYAQYINQIFSSEVKYFKLISAITMLISFVMSLLNFRGITQFLVPILEISYPSLIILTFLCMITRKYKKLKIFTFYLTLAIMCVLKFK